LHSNKVHATTGIDAGTPDAAVVAFVAQVRAFGVEFEAFAVALELVHAKCLADVLPAHIDEGRASCLPKGGFQRVKEAFFAARIAQLVPPPLFLQQWMDEKKLPADSKTLGPKALEWLKAGLHYAHRDPALKTLVLQLLGTSAFTKNLEHMRQFKQLKEFARAESLALGIEKLKAYFDTANLGSRLGNVKLPLYQGREFVTQEHFIALYKSAEAVTCNVCTPRSLELTATYDFEAEVVYMHLLRMVSLAVNADFQRVTAEIARQQGGECSSVPIKGMGRMVNKLHSRDDHRILPQALLDEKKSMRSGQNIDVVRNACTFDTVEGMAAFIEHMVGTFEGVARAKNMFAYNEAQAEEQFHYRTIMLNVVYPPPKGDGFARTFGELAAQSEQVWDDYVETVSDQVTFSPSCWRMHAKQARAHLRQMAADNMPLHIICETQVLLRPYMNYGSSLTSFTKCCVPKAARLYFWISVLRVETQLASGMWTCRNSI
jgi:hypothetical protein